MRTTTFKPLRTRPDTVIRETILANKKDCFVPWQDVFL